MPLTKRLVLIILLITVNNNFIKTKLKLIAIKIFHWLGSGLVLFSSLLAKIILVIFKPVSFVYKKIFKPASLHLYLNLFSSKRFWRKFLQNSHNTWHNIINQKITLYFILFLIIFMVVANSLYAQEIPPEDLGKKSIMYELVAQEAAIEIIVDSAPAQVTNLDKITPQDLSITNEEELAQTEPLPENTLSLTSEGSSLMASDETATPHTRTTVEEYTVLPGDTISSIAKQFSISINSVLWSNNLSSYSIIRPGDTLKILPISGIIYEVKKGDTISSIASKYQANEKDILINNNITEGSLAVGTEIIVPGGVPPAPKITVTRPSVSVSKIFNATPATDSGTRLLWPAISHRINQYYNWRHNGIDVNGRSGDPIYASEAGKVEISGWNNHGYGYYIVINHGNGIKTLYAHCSKLLVEVGDTVTRGQIIGNIGSTGRSTGPHIHYEVHVNGKTVNPLVYTK